MAPGGQYDEAFRLPVPQDPGPGEPAAGEGRRANGGRTGTRLMSDPAGLPRRSRVPHPVTTSGSSTRSIRTCIATTLDFLLKFSEYDSGGAGAFAFFCLSRSSPADPTRYAPLFSGFARPALTPTEQADASERDEAGGSDQSSHLNNHALTSVAGREGGSSEAQAFQAAREADRGLILRPVKKSATPSRSVRQTIASTARGHQ